jgi:hypothetical protein
MKRFWIGLLGGTVLLLGLVMLIAPGPGLPTILLALAILASEFLWARLWLQRCRKLCDRAPLPRKPKVWMRWLTRRALRQPTPAVTAAGPTSPLPR